MKRLHLTEDDLAVTESLQELLGELGYRVEVSESAEEALLSFEHRAPALWILDESLPGLSGSKALGQWRARHPEEHFPVIGLSGFPESRNTMQAVGVEAYFDKPLDISQLIAEVANLLAEEKV